MQPLNETDPRRGGSRWAPIHRLHGKNRAHRRQGRPPQGRARLAADFLMQIPQKRPRRSGFNNPFDNPFFDDAFRMMGPTQQVTVKSDAAELEVKPLPAEGQPKSFAGAVGEYTLCTSVKPSTVSAGDPITLTAKIEGRGNFDRVTAPQLADPPAGAPTRPPPNSRRMTISASAARRPSKWPSSPRPGKTASPAVEWSYFDPEKERYVHPHRRLRAASRSRARRPLRPRPPVRQPRQRPWPPPRRRRAGYPLYPRRFHAAGARPSRRSTKTGSSGTAQAVPLLALLGFLGLRVRSIRAADLQGAASGRNGGGKKKPPSRRCAGGTCRRANSTRPPPRPCGWRPPCRLGRGPPRRSTPRRCSPAASSIRPRRSASASYSTARPRRSTPGPFPAAPAPSSPETQADTLDLLKKYENAKVVS